MKYGSDTGEVIALIIFIIAFIALCIACAFMCPDSGHSHGHHVVVTGRPVPVYVRPHAHVVNPGFVHHRTPNVYRPNPHSFNHNSNSATTRTGTFVHHGKP